MPLRTPEKKSPLSGEGREVLSSSAAAESEGVENFDSSEPVGRRVSLSDMISHAGEIEMGIYVNHSKTSLAATFIYRPGGEGSEELTTEGASSTKLRLKTCCVRMFGEISSSKVSSVIESPFLGDAGG